METSALSSSSRRPLVCDPEEPILLDNDGGGSSAERTAQTAYTERPYSVGGTTHSGDSDYLEVAYRKGKDETTGIDVEEGLVSAQWGAQNEVTLKVGHVGVSTADGASLGVDALAFRAAAGIHNPDGSTGVNLAFKASIVSATATLDDGATRLSAGTGIGYGTSVSIGVRDKNADGTPEICADLSVFDVGLRGCISLPF